MINVVKIYPGFGTPSDELGMVDQDFVVLDSSWEHQFLVVLELVNVVLEVVEIFPQVLYFLGPEEVKHPSSA